MLEGFVQIGNFDVFVGLVSKLRLAGAKNYHRRCQRGKVRAIGRKANGLCFAGPQAGTKVLHKTATAISL